MATTAGYSGTPLAKKLGIKEGSRVLLLDPPDQLAALLAPLPPDVVFEKKPGTRTTLAHVFVTEKNVLARRLRELRTALGPEVAVWVSWPKKSARLPTDVTEDVIREVALPLGWVDVKVCAVSEIWSGLKLVVRRELRQGVLAAAKGPGRK